MHKHLSTLLFALAIATAAFGASADCADPNFDWSATNPPVNVRHVFCGAFNAQGRPTGLHSMAIVNTSAIILGVNNPANPRNGVYDATVAFTNNGVRSQKMSTFFPNACSQGQITASIVYAANNQTGPAQPWGVLGPSAPQNGGNAYCLGSNGQPIVIRMGLLNDGRVNTAFPN
ncbi:MAG: EndoU domain-containing protein [Betaproteobacteria bacterium]|nr:EndoU domain-containing protein [Betaproteobacteria bacterium]